MQLIGFCAGYWVKWSRKADIGAYTCLLIRLYVILPCSAFENLSEMHVLHLARPLPRYAVLTLDPCLSEMTLREMFLQTTVFNATCELDMEEAERIDRL